MHDFIHAAIATERVRDLVEMADERRATRRSKASSVAFPVPAEAPAIARRNRTAALLRLRPRLR